MMGNQMCLSLLSTMRRLSKEKKSELRKKFPETSLDGVYAVCYTHVKYQ